MHSVGAPIIDLAELAEDWITTEKAADMLCVQPKALLKVRGQTVRRVRRGKRGRNAAGTCMWWRRDVEDLARIKKRSQLSLNVALRIMAAERPRQ